MAQHVLADCNRVIFFIRIIIFSDYAKILELKVILFLGHLSHSGDPLLLVGVHRRSSSDDIFSRDTWKVNRDGKTAYGNDIALR